MQIRRFVLWPAVALSLAASAAVASATFVPAPAPDWSRGTTAKVSIGAFRGEARGSTSDHAAISADGRYVAFQTSAGNLVHPHATCGRFFHCEFLYVRDQRQRTTKLLAAIPSPYRSGANANGIHSMWFTAISANGRYVSFSTLGSLYNPGGKVWVLAPQQSFNVYLVDRVTGSVELASRNSAGRPAKADPLINGLTVYNTPLSGAFAASLSADGRYVEFTSDATNLGGPPVTRKHVYNVYRRDRKTGDVRLVSVGATGQTLPYDSETFTGTAISGDGRFIVFDSFLTSGGFARQDYVWDAATGRSRNISAVPGGRTPKGSDTASISQDGTHVVFFSDDALVPTDTNGTTDAYEADVVHHTMTLISVRSDGTPTAWVSRADYALEIPWAATVSADGRFAAFDARANLLPGGATQPAEPLHSYVHDLLTGKTFLVSVDSAGHSLGGDSGAPYISGSGRVVTFSSTTPATPGDAKAQVDVFSRVAG